ncbi:hypothetical protein GCM10020001_051200 [Nonomuraea salmonea]
MFQWAAAVGSDLPMSSVFSGSQTMMTVATTVRAMPSSHARNLGGTFSASSCTSPTASHRGASIDPVTW